MSDKETLILAAKAAGYELEEQTIGGITNIYRTWHPSPWNPLVNDGDCYRLETDLGLDIQWLKDGVLIDGYEYQSYDEHGGNKDDARKYAVVRAAAEIGKQKE